MKLQQSFEVAAPLERVWEALIDVPRVAPCLPGASVTGRNEDGSFNGEFKVKIGPTSAAYSGKLNLAHVDADGRTTTIDASGTDKRGQGGAKATIVSSVAPSGDGRTKVEVATDYQITGRLARFGRGGMIDEISVRLLGEFSDNLQVMLSDAEPSPAPDPEAAITGATPAADPVPGPADPDLDPAPPFTAAPESEPPAAATVLGASVLMRVKQNPVPIAALVAGFLVALRVLRRRS